MSIQELELDPELLWLVVMGPGYGESVVLAVPARAGPDWIAVDSLRRQDARGDFNPATALLEANSAYLSAVALTHLHLDHSEGLVQLLDRRIVGTPVGCLPAYLDPKLEWEPRDDAGVLLGAGARVAALNRIDEIWRSERGSRWDLLAGRARRVGGARLSALHPGVIPPKRPRDLNMISNPILLEWRDCRILLGADLPKSGWRKVGASYAGAEPLSSTQALKVSHHGAGGAQHSLAIGDPPPAERACVLTPFNRGKRLPDFSDGGGVDLLLRSHSEVAVTALLGPGNGAVTPRAELSPAKGGFGGLALAYEARPAPPGEAWVAVAFDPSGNEVERRHGAAAGTVA